MPRPETARGDLSKGSSGSRKWSSNNGNADASTGPALLKRLDLIKKVRMLTFPQPLFRMALLRVSTVAAPWSFGSICVLLATTFQFFVANNKIFHLFCLSTWICISSSSNSPRSGCAHVLRAEYPHLLCFPGVLVAVYNATTQS
jgi:hypothetical protein